MNQATITTLAAVAAFAVTACAGSARPAAGSAHPAQNIADTASGATCAQSAGTIQDLVNAQAIWNASQQTETDDVTYILALEEAIAIIHAGGPIDAQPRWSSMGRWQLNHDLYAFNADANRLTQGDTSVTSTVGADIGDLGAECGISATSSGSPAAGSPARSPRPPAPSMAKQTDTVVFRVRGTGYPSIQYGSDSSDHQATGGYGPLGDGNALPWTASLPYDPSAQYYVVTAQLEGSGSITDSVTEVIKTWCSDGTRKTESFPLAHGSASGGYAIASAQSNGLGSGLGSGTGNAQQAESDPGC